MLAGWQAATLVMSTIILSIGLHMKSSNVDVMNNESGKAFRPRNHSDSMLNLKLTVCHSFRYGASDLL